MSTKVVNSIGLAFLSSCVALGQAAGQEVKLEPGIVYHYKASSEIFKKRLNWIAVTLPYNHFIDYDKIFKEAEETPGIRWFEWVRDTLSGPPLAQALAIEKKMIQGEVGRHIERHNRMLPKSKDCKKWETAEIESLPEVMLKSDEMKNLLDAVEKWNMRLQKRVESIQNAKVVDHYSAFVYRPTDAAIVFIGGVSWTYPFRSDGYTEFHLLLSAKTGKVITEKLGYTNAIFEPGDLEQIKEVAVTAVAIAKLFRGK